MTDPTADAAKLLPCPFPWRGDDGSIEQCVERNHCGCGKNTRPQPAPVEGEPDFAREADMLLPDDFPSSTDPNAPYTRGYRRQNLADEIAAELRRAYRLGLAARPKVEDADAGNFGPGSWRRLLAQLREVKSKLAECEAELAKAYELIATNEGEWAVPNIKAMAPVFDKAQADLAARQQQKGDGR